MEFMKNARMMWFIQQFWYNSLFQEDTFSTEIWVISPQQISSSNSSAQHHLTQLTTNTGPGHSPLENTCSTQAQKTGGGGGDLPSERLSQDYGIRGGATDSNVI